jgi:methyl-accepting chemotaxis protein
MHVKQLQRDIIQQKNEKLSKGTRQPLPESKTSSKVINSNPKRRNQLWANTHDKDLQQRILHQEEHIDALQENLNELLQNGISLGVSLTQQNQLLDKLDVGADELREETKMVTRRADRLSHRSVSIVVSYGLLWSRLFVIVV